MNPKKKIHLVAMFVVLLVLTFFFIPVDAFADKVNFSTVIGSLRTLVTVLFLPLAMVICAWRIIYIAVFAGMMGVDPLNMVSDTDQDGQISGAEVVSAIKAHLSGFFHGLLWIGGLFLIFQLALTVAGILADTVSKNF